MVLGSNPSRPTNQPIDVAVVRKIGAITRVGSIGQLKLFSQLFKTEIILIQGTAREYLLLRRTEGTADGTIQQELALLKRMFSLASRATPPKVARVPYIQMPTNDNVRKGFIEHEGYTRLLAALPDYLRPIVTMAYCTGMRRGEILSLR